jgi:hypothetical protein
MLTLAFVHARDQRLDRRQHTRDDGIVTGRG